jgi:hypothetical protein
VGNIGEAAQAAYQVWGAGAAVGSVAAGAVAGGGASGGGGGFEFPSADEMNAVLGMWKDRQTSLQEKQNQIDAALGSLSQLADDQESQGYLQQARDSLMLLQTQHDSMLDYVKNYIQKLTDATNTKRTNEDDSRAAFQGGPAT